MRKQTKKKRCPQNKHEYPISMHTHTRSPLSHPHKKTLFYFGFTICHKLENRMCWGMTWRVKKRKRRASEWVSELSEWEREREGEREGRDHFSHILLVLHVGVKIEQNSKQEAASTNLKFSKNGSDRIVSLFCLVLKINARGGRETDSDQYQCNVVTSISAAIILLYAWFC